MIMLGSGKTNVAEDFLKNLIPCSSALFESIDSFEELKNFSVAADLNVTVRTTSVEGFSSEELCLDAQNSSQVRAREL